MKQHDKRVNRSKILIRNSVSSGSEFEIDGGDYVVGGGNGNIEDVAGNGDSNDDIVGIGNEDGIDDNQNDILVSKKGKF